MTDPQNDFLREDGIRGNGTIINLETLLTATRDGGDMDCQTTAGIRPTPGELH